MDKGPQNEELQLCGAHSLGTTIGRDGESSFDAQTPTITILSGAMELTHNKSCKITDTTQHHVVLKPIFFASDP